MKRIVTLSLLLTSIVLNAQEVAWFTSPEIQEGANISNTGYTTTCDPAGNVYLAGFAANAYNYNDVYGDIYYNKYASDGSVILSQTFTGKAAVFNIIADSQGNTVLALSLIDEVTIGETTITQLPGVEPGHIIVKLDANGSLLWHKTLHAVDFEYDAVTHFSGVAIDANDNVYAAYDNYMYSYITKYSPSGEALATITQQHVNLISSVAVDTEGNIYGAGSCANGMATYAGVFSGTDLTYNTYVVKYSPEGVFQWVKYIDDITCPSPAVVARTPDEVYVSSFLFTNEDIGGIDIEGPGQMFDDFYLAKINSDGEFQWVREVPGAGKGGPGNRNFIKLDTNGNVYFAGFTGGSIDWAYNINTSVEGFSNNDAFVLKCSPDGQVLFAKNWGGGSYDRVDGISLNNDGDVFICGMVNGTGSFGGFPFESTDWEYRPYLAKISQPTAGTHNPEAKTAVLYPNPATDYINITGLTGNVRGSVMNVMGQKVMDFSTDGTASINVAVLPAGTYFVMIKGFKASKFIKR